MVEGNREQREIPSDFQLTIVVHRHGEKASLAGALSQRGKEDAAVYFSDAYKNVALDLPEGQGVDIEYSPIDRTQETAFIAAQYEGAKINSIRSDERLSEGAVAHHKELLDAWGGLGGRWISTWMGLTERPLPDVKTGQEVVRDFTQWLLEKINNRHQMGGVQEIDAFSHFPVMIAFLAKLEEISGEQLLPDGWQSEKDAVRLVNFLESFNCYTDSKESKTVMFNFKGKRVLVPIAKLEEICQS